MSTSVGEQFANDEKTMDLLDQLVDRLSSHQADLSAPRPPKTNGEQSYQQLIDSVESLRGRGLFYPYISSGLGNGPLVELADGSVKYDFITGIGVHYLGHSDPELTRTVLKSALEDTVMQGNLQQNEDSVRLMESLLNIANGGGAGLDHCFLTSSGAMANENALKMLFHRRERADRVLTVNGAFAGRTMALAQVTDKPGYRVGLPETLEVDRIPFVGRHQPTGAVESAVSKLDQLMDHHADQYGCMMIELVQGEGGFYPIHPEYLTRLTDRLDEYDVPLFVDEIQSFGRTDEPFAFQRYGIDRDVDVVTVGKMTQACATLFRERWNPEPGLISQTFTSSTSAIAASRHVLEELNGGNYFGENGRNAEIHRKAVNHLQSIRDRRPELVSGPYGIGSMVAFQVGNGDRETTIEVLHQLYDRGVIGFLTGDNPTRIRLLLPGGAIEDKQIEDAFGIIEDTLVECTNLP